MADPTALIGADPFGEQRKALAEHIVARHYQIDPALATRYGPAGRAQCLRDAEYHLSFLADAVAAATPGLFADYVAWAKIMLEARGIPDHDLRLNLECMRDVLVNALPRQTGAAAATAIAAGLATLQENAHMAPVRLSDAAGPLAGLTGDYLQALLRGERHIASRLILQAVESGIPVKDIYTEVFQQSQYEVGRLWQMNEISVAQEHYCTAATQMIMSQLYPYIFSGRRTDRTAVAACITGDLHEIGARIVSDLLEMEGWNTIYLGADVPATGVVKLLAEHDADLLALSVTMAFHLRAAAHLIRDVRHGAGKVKIMVGGRAFNIAPDLWRRIGADGFARSGTEAISTAERLFKGASP